MHAFIGHAFIGHAFIGHVCIYCSAYATDNLERF